MNWKRTIYVIFGEIYELYSNPQKLIETHKWMKLKPTQIEGELNGKSRKNGV